MIKIFTQYPNLIYGISEKIDGTMRLPIEENRKKYFKKLDINYSDVIAASLAHGNNVQVINDSSIRVVDNCDAMITDKKNIILTITAADCFPVYFFYPAKQIIGIAHVGWRGVVAETAKYVISKMVATYGISPEDLLISIGPGIQKCHFDIKEENVSKYKNYSEYMSRRDNKTFVDLRGIIIRQLTEKGALPENINATDECTFDLNEKYYSYRRDRPETIEAMVAYIGIK